MNSSQVPPPEKKELILLPDPLTIVGVLKNATASSVQFSAQNFTNWHTLPTALIEEATFLGVLEDIKASRETLFPLYSIAVTRPQTQSEHFFFNLIMPPLFHAAKNSNWTAAKFKPAAAAESGPTHRSLQTVVVKGHQLKKYGR